MRNASSWQQLEIFASDRQISRAETRSLAQRVIRRLSHTRVTRDPAVAESNTQNQSLSHDLRESLATFVAGLSAERRAALRQRLGLAARPASDAA